MVVDPVMVAESGARLLDESAHHALVERIMPRATVATQRVPSRAGSITSGCAAGGNAEANSPAGSP